MAGGCEHLKYEKGPFPIHPEFYQKLVAKNSDFLRQKKQMGHLMTLDFPNGRGEKKVLIILPEHWGCLIDFENLKISADGYTLTVPISNLNGNFIKNETVNPYEITEDQYNILQAKPRIIDDINPR